MTTAYNIYIKAPQLADCQDVVSLLERNGASDREEIIGSEWPERWQVSWPELGALDVVNERLHPVGTAWDDEPMFGYDFCLTVNVRFEHDDETTRDSILELAQLLADRYPTVVIYNYEHTLATLGQPSAADVLDTTYGYVAPGIDRPEIRTALEEAGIRPGDVGLSDE